MSHWPDIDTLLDEIVTLPSLPGVVERVTSLVDDPDSSVRDVASVIATDPSLSIKVLRLVNSAFFGIRERVASVDHAVTLLGMKVVRNLVLTATVFEAFEKGANRLFRHSVACGVLMRSMALYGPPDLPNEEIDTFVYGLLHDIGKVIFDQYLPAEAREAAQYAASERVPSFEAERTVIGIDHAEMGGRLAAKWNLPDELVGAIDGHHDLVQCTSEEARPIAATLSVADFICTQAGIGSFEGATVRVPEAAWELSGLTGPRVGPVLEAFFRDLPTVDDLLGAAGSP